MRRDTVAFRLTFPWKMEFTSLFQTQWDNREQWKWYEWRLLSQNEDVPMAFIETHLDPEQHKGKKVENRWDYSHIARRLDVSLPVVLWVYQQITSFPKKEGRSNYFDYKSFFEELSEHPRFQLEWFQRCPDAPWRWKDLLCHQPQIPPEDIINNIPQTFHLIKKASPHLYRYITRKHAYLLCETRKLTLREYAALNLPPWNVFVFRDLLKHSVERREPVRLEDVWDTWHLFGRNELGGVVEEDDEESMDSYTKVPVAIQECRTLLQTHIDRFPTELLEDPSEWKQNCDPSFLCVFPDDRDMRFRAKRATIL
mmetsp:Transcript_6053/g.14714  ORF Transcript_6053/g.14714 Transcript_6053/m.14714 type:complete len:311 (-) Transcript_6053:155-1087(-)